MALEKLVPVNCTYFRPEKMENYYFPRVMSAYISANDGITTWSRQKIIKQSYLFNRIKMFLTRRKYRQYDNCKIFQIFNFIVDSYNAKYTFLY